MSAFAELEHWASQLGWQHDDLTYEDDRRMRFWRREGEKMQLIWRSGQLSAAESWCELPEVQGQLQVRDPAEAVAVLRTSEPTYDFTEMPDEVVAKYLSGKTIEWVNNFTGVSEKDTVPRDAKSTRVYRTRMGRRVLTFANTSFRSVGLDAIIEIR